jgi:hypothetical protein
MNYITKAYQGFDIRIDPTTRYISFTDMAKVSGKLVGNWLKLKGTKEFLTALADDMQLEISNRDLDFNNTTDSKTLEPAQPSLHPIGEMGNINGSGYLIEVVQSFDREQGTWGHPDVALAFAQWCNPMFAIQVSRWVNELLTTGKVELPKAVKTPPGTIEDGYFPWNRRNEQKIAWQIKKIKDAAKNKCLTLLDADRDGFCLYDFFTIDGETRIFSFYADTEDHESVSEMQTFWIQRIKAGAKIIA